MLFLLVLIAAAVIGGIIGRKVIKPGKKIKGLDKIQSVTVFILIFFMGIRIGSDQRIFQSIYTIGTSSIVITIMTVAGSLCAAFLLRKLLKLNKEGSKGID